MRSSSSLGQRWAASGFWLLEGLCQVRRCDWTESHSISAKRPKLRTVLAGGVAEEGATGASTSRGFGRWEMGDRGEVVPSAGVF